MQDKKAVGERKGKAVNMRLFHLEDCHGVKHLAAEGQDTGSGDGHYVMCTVAQSQAMHPYPAPRAALSSTGACCLPGPP